MKHGNDKQIIFAANMANEGPFIAWVVVMVVAVVVVVDVVEKDAGQDYAEW